MPDNAADAMPRKQINFSPDGPVINVIQTTIITYRVVVEITKGIKRQEVAERNYSMVSIFCEENPSTALFTILLKSYTFRPLLMQQN
jgi:hypothetical protein